MDSVKILRVQVLDNKLNITFDERLDEYETVSPEEVVVTEETLENGYTIFVWEKTAA